MLTSEVWETANGILAILGAFITFMVVAYLVRNWHRTYSEPVRLITLAFAAVIFGHAIKDGAAYFARCCGVTPYDSVILLSLGIIAIGKVGCIMIWSDPQWGRWPWIIVGGLVAAFLIVTQIIL